jgi:tetratricopeptide (TPR) repeat protein
MTVPPEIDGTVLISESDLDGVESGDGILNPYDSFRQMKPVAILQDSVYVFQGKFAVPLASAWVDIRRSMDLARAGQTDEALRLAQEAVALVPDSPRAQLQFADMLAAHERWGEALAHYRLAQTDLQAQRPDLQGEELEPRILAGLQSAASHP